MSTITVIKGNVELDVPADERERYVKLGYSVIDKATGKIIEEAPITDVGALQVRVAELVAENTKLKAEITKLKGEKKTASKVKND